MRYVTPTMRTAAAGVVTKDATANPCDYFFRRRFDPVETLAGPEFAVLCVKTWLIPSWDQSWLLVPSGTFLT